MTAIVTSPLQDGAAGAGAAVAAGAAVVAGAAVAAGAAVVVTACFAGAASSSLPQPAAIMATAIKPAIALIMNAERLFVPRLTISLFCIWSIPSMPEPQALPSATERQIISLTSCATHREPLVLENARNGKKWSRVPSGTAINTSS